MRKLINVTKEHIKKGERKMSQSCPVALAIKTAFPDRFVEVGSHNILMSKTIYKMSRSVERFIKKFDDGKKVKPFRFILKY